MGYTGFWDSLLHDGGLDQWGDLQGLRGTFDNRKAQEEHMASLDGYGETTLNGMVDIINASNKMIIEQREQINVLREKLTAAYAPREAIVTITLAPLTGIDVNTLASALSKYGTLDVRFR